MKKNLARMMAGMVVVLGLAIPSFAQYAGPMKVTVPFDFAVENDHLKAGDYTIERIANGRLRIHNNDGSVSTVFLAMPTQGTVTQAKAHFIFHRYGGDYFLASIWTPGQEAGWELLQGKLEVELAKKKTTPVETATVVGH